MRLTSEYRIISGKIVDYRDTHILDSRTNYIGIGHGRKGKRYQLWAWLNNQVEVSDVIDVSADVSREWEDDSHSFPKGPRHEDLWGDRYENTFYGRFEFDTEDLSVVVPDRWRHRPVPSSIINELGEIFHYKTIHIF